VTTEDPAPPYPGFVPDGLVVATAVRQVTGLAVGWLADVDQGHQFPGLRLASVRLHGDTPEGLVDEVFILPRLALIDLLAQLGTHDPMLYRELMSAWMARMLLIEGADGADPDARPDAGQASA